MMQYPIVWREDEVGSFTCQQEGLFLRFVCRFRLQESAVYRLWIEGERERLLLGVPEPTERGEWVLRKRLSQREIERIGKVRRAVLLTENLEEGKREEWRNLSELGAFFEGNSPFASALQGKSKLLWKQEGDRRALAIPFSPYAPMPLIELFCMAQFLCRKDGWYVVYYFNRQGEPIWCIP